MDQFFPTTYSTLASAPLGVFLSARYGWDQARCHLMLRGVSDTYNISTSSGNFVVRIYRAGHRSLSHIKAEIQLLTELKNKDVSVSYPLPDQQGHYIFDVQAAEGTRYGVVFTHAPGKVFPSPTDRQLKLLGQEIGKFHQVSTTVRLQDQRWNFDLETTLVKPLLDIKEYFQACPDEWAWLSHAANEASNVISQLDSSGFNSGYCHFDFFPKNFHFQNEESITIFDFDFFGYGWVVNDLMTFQQHLCLEAEIGRMSESTSVRMFNVFTEAYLEVRNLSQKELASIPLLSLGFWLFYFGFYTTHDQFLPLLQNPHLKARANLIRQITSRSSRMLHSCV